MQFTVQAKYARDATRPTGRVQFHLDTGSRRFESTSLEWLVVSGARAQLAGTGTLDGQSGYAFALTGIDGGNADRLGIRIWSTPSGVVVYDSIDPTTSLGGGNITVHR